MIHPLLALAVVAQAPDSAHRARVERALAQATDSIGAVQIAAAGFRTDLAQASWALVLQRAARVHASCRGADSALAELASVLAAGSVSRGATRAQAQLASGTVDARRTLAQCQREWSVPARAVVSDADTLRAWGPYRTSQLDGALRRYLATLRSFKRAVGQS